MDQGQRVANDRNCSCYSNSLWEYTFSSTVAAAGLSSDSESEGDKAEDDSNCITLENIPSLQLSSTQDEDDEESFGLAAEELEQYQQTLGLVDSSCKRNLRNIDLVRQCCPEKALRSYDDEGGLEVAGGEGGLEVAGVRYKAKEASDIEQGLKAAGVRYKAKEASDIEQGRRQHRRSGDPRDSK
ncbi:hypothetical protein CRENBAI_004293 [Crenichthys baileyi]|uniref:Uncharacterized protein n=1 Tax=Crenichthys baileyi TaxID=28760 RepID=A0AAV9RZH4_9TELE